MSGANVTSLSAVRVEEDRRQRIAMIDAALAKNDRGQVLGCLSNLILIVGQDPMLADLCRHDEFRCADVLMGAAPPPLEGATALPGPFPRPWTGADVSHVQSYIQRVWAHQAKRPDTEEAMTAVAGMRRFHPVRDWLNGLVWDEHPRLDHWLADAFGVTHDAYHAAVGAKFLIGAVARARRPGCKFDNMLILEGPQNIGKSRACRELAGADWFTDSLPSQLDSRDAALALTSRWMVEFAEIEQLIRAEVEIIKAFISRPVDRFRAPYARGFVEWPRQCVLIGTTNDTGYLRDPTGNRRFWPVKCLFADVDWIVKNRTQLFAEAAAREAFGEQLWISDEQIVARAEREQSDRLQDDVWEPRVDSYLMGRAIVTVSEILSEALSMPVAQQSRREQMRIADILKRNGWQRHTRRDGAKTVKRWERNAG